MISKAAQRCVLVAAMVLRPAVVLGQIPFTVTPGNQPAATDPAARLKAYSDLNLKLSGAVEEPASSCLKSYAEYQACVAGKGTAGCASAPTCLVTATLPAMDLSGISFHFVPGVDAATLVPVATNVPAAAPPPATMGVMGMGAGTPGGVMGGMTGGTGPIVVTTRPRPTAPLYVSGGVITGIRTKEVLPVYPPVAKVMHLSGTVVLHAIISKQGTVDTLTVSSATSPIFENAAVNAVRQWQYKPYLLNGEPTEVDTTVTVNFNLNQPKPNTPGVPPN